MKTSMLIILFLLTGTAQSLDLPSSAPLWNGASYNDAVPSTGADKLHALGITGKGLTTAIIDSGFETSHGIYNGRIIFENYARAADADSTEHGNHVAGITVSMAPDSDLWLADFTSQLDAEDGSTYTPAFEKLLADVTNGNKYNIVSVNNSWAYLYSYYATEEDATNAFEKDGNAVKQLLDSGIAVVAGSGNDAMNDLLFVPSGFPCVVSVGALNQYGNIADFSNQAGVNLLAPGVDIFSAGLGGGYGPVYGTSIATPHVTGAITLLKSGARAASTEEIISALYDSAMPVEYDGSKILRVEHVPEHVPEEEKGYDPSGIYSTLLDLTRSGNDPWEHLGEYFNWLDRFIPRYIADEVTADEWRTFALLANYAASVWSSYNVPGSENDFFDDERNELYGENLFLEIMKLTGGLDSKLENQTFGFIQVDAAYRLLTARRSLLMAESAALSGSSHAGALSAFSREMGAYLDQNLVDLFQRLDGQPAGVLARAARQLGPGRVADTLHSSMFGILGLHNAAGRRLFSFRERSFFRAEESEEEPPVAAQDSLANLRLSLPSMTTLWAEGFGSYQQRDETRDSGGYHGSFAGVMAGIERDFGEALAGGFAAWANHNIRGDGASRGNWGTFGLYGGLIRDRFSAGLSVAAGMGDYGLTRVVDGPAASLIGMDYAPIRVSANGDSRAFSLSARASAEWTLLDRGGWSVGPGIEGAFAHSFMNGYTERDGGGINLSVRRHGESYAEGGAGLRASKTLFRRDSDKPFLTASVKAAALYGAGFGSDMTARFTGAGSSFAVKPERLKSAFFVPEASLSWRATERVTVSASYQGRFGRHTSFSMGSLSVGLNW